MKRVAPVAVVLAIVLAAGLLWKCRGGEPESTPTTAGKVATVGSAGHTATHDPRTGKRASIGGTITDDTKRPAAKVRVCAEFWSELLPASSQKDPVCATTDDHGAYRLDNLLAATYRVIAGGKPYRPQQFHPDGDRHRSSFPLLAGEAKSGVDLVMERGGVEVTGVVADISGGPVAHAAVTGSSSRWGTSNAAPPVDTDDAGKFTLWVAEGPVSLSAIADGYAEGTARGRAPGTFEILLTPESILSGTVVDARTQAPVPGATVTVTAGEFSYGTERTDLTDAEGKFRVDGLTPGRYVATARTSAGYGRTEGSTLVGLGQHVDGVVVKLFPAQHLEGRVMIAGAPATVCLEGRLELQDQAHDRYLGGTTDAAGNIHLDGVLPGTYQVDVSCPRFLAREKYDPIVVADKDLTDLTWEVGAGATVRGKVTTKSGEPIAEAPVWAQSTGGAARAKSGWASDKSTRDGSYELDGVRAGAYKLQVSSERGIAPVDGFRITVAEGAKLDKDLVLDDGGKIAGTVVDETGKPVPDVQIRPRALASATFGFNMGDIKSDAAGNFTIEGMRPGDYRVVASLGWMDELRKPGSNDDAKQGESATVKPNATTTVHLVVESRAEAIIGVVVDGDGKPVPDAFLSAARESDAAGARRSDVASTRGWGWGDTDRPVLTATDGTFTVGKLSKGNYTLRAYRKGGGEAVVEHVATGSRTRLEIKKTGSIEGRIRAATSGAPPEIRLAMTDPKSGFSRDESFYMTDGTFAIRDLPAGHFRITASGGDGQKTLEVELANGETKTGVEIVLDVLVELTGRVVERGTTNPVVGMRMMASLAQSGGGMFTFGGMSDDENENISDEAGHFKIKRVPVGMVQITGFPKDFRDSDYAFFRGLKTLERAGNATTIDVGDLSVIKKRVKQGDKIGELGIHFAAQPPDTAPDKRELKISWIDPTGPAAKLDVKLGDVIKSVDGSDVTGANATDAYTLMNAPPGTSLALGLVRGVTVTVVLAAP